MIQKVLSELCKCFGQKVSLSKYLLHVSANVSAGRAKDISQNLGIKLTNDQGKYLGMSAIHRG